MDSTTHHRIIGVKLITMYNEELDLAADVEWSLDIWKARGFETVEDRVIGVGSQIALDDPDLKSSRMEFQDPWATTLRK